MTPPPNGFKESIAEDKNTNGTNSGGVVNDDDDQGERARMNQDIKELVTAAEVVTASHIIL